MSLLIRLAVGFGGLAAAILLWEVAQSKYNGYVNLKSEKAALVVELEKEKLISAEKEQRRIEARESADKMAALVKKERDFAGVREKKLRLIESEKEENILLLAQCRIATDSLRR